MEFKIERNKPAPDTSRRGKMYDKLTAHFERLMNAECIFIPKSELKPHFKDLSAARNCIRTGISRRKRSKTEVAVRISNDGLRIWRVPKHGD